MAQESPPSGTEGEDSGRRRPSRPPKPPSLTDQFRSPGFWVGLILVVIVNYLIVNVFLAPPQPQQVTIFYTAFK